MRRLGLALAALALIAAAPAMWLSKPATLAKDVAAAPRILVPTTPQTAKINAALDRFDRRMRVELASFKADCGSGGERDRDIAVPMRSPAFLSLYVMDNYWCEGAAHPDASQLALTYDLSTGKPIDWAGYLPVELVVPSALEDLGDGSKIGVVKSPVLLAWYRKTVMSGPDSDADWREQCTGVFDDISLVLWIDAKGDGVAMQPSSLPHVVAACGESAVMTTAELRRRGAKAALTNAIDAAHAAHGWVD